MIIYTIITLLFFGILSKFGYATDTYQVFNWDGEKVYTQFASSGRFITALAGKAVKDLRLSENTIYMLSYVLAIFCIILSQYILYKILREESKNHNNTTLEILVPTLIVINPFLIELFLFIENGIMTLGILMSILAVKNFIKYVKSNSKKYIFYSIILMFIANCSYQGIIGLFICIATIFILKESKNCNVVKNLFVAIFIYCLPAFFNFALVKMLYKANRLSGKIEIIASIKKMLTQAEQMVVKNYNILPNFMFILAILFTFSVFCYKIRGDEKKHKEIIKFLCIIIITFIFAIAPQIIQPTSNIWLVPRTTYCFGALYGILLAFILIRYKFKNKEKVVIYLLSAVLIFFQIKSFYAIEIGRYEVNQKDKEVSMQIIEKINQYEQNTGNIIMQIEKHNDTSPNFTYQGVLASGDINVKCFANDWSTVAILNYYSKRNFKIKMADTKNDIENNWNEFNEEQIQFKENTLIVYNY